MTDSPRYTLNRGMVILHHRQPFLDWLQSTDPEPLERLTLEEMEHDGDAFLIPCDESRDPVDSEQDAIKWVEKRWRMFFEHCLNDWLQDESLWPEKRSLKMFREWFSIEYRSMVWDLVNEPLVVEDWENENDHEDEIMH
jgi:hypothetical protein